MIDRHPNVKGICPACGNKTLFLGEGGYVTCSLIGCMNPGAASEVLESIRSVGIEKMRTAISEVFEVLDDKLGDTDPIVPDEFTDEDIRIEMPLFWCVRKLSPFIGSDDKCQN